MKEYIKKFNSVSVADGHIIDNPFVTTIIGQGNLVCNEPNKKLKLEDGKIVIANADISFTILENGGGPYTYHANPGMTWAQWIDSDYESSNYRYDDSQVFWHDRTNIVIDAEDVDVQPNDPIENVGAYKYWHD